MTVHGPEKKQQRNGMSHRRGVLHHTDERRWDDGVWRHSRKALQHLRVDLGQL